MAKHFLHRRATRSLEQQQVPGAAIDPQVRRQLRMGGGDHDAGAVETRGFRPGPVAWWAAIRRVCSCPCNETGTPLEFGPGSAELVADARAGALGKLDYVAAQA